MQSFIKISVIYTILGILLITPTQCAVQLKDHGWINESFWSIYEVDHFKGFNGSVTHIHIQDPGDWVDLVKEALGVASLSSGLLGFLLVIDEGATNNDGSYDFYSIDGTIWQPTTKLNNILIINPMILIFNGFISDSWWKVPLDLNPNQVFINLSLLDQGEYSDLLKEMAIEKATRAYPNRIISIKQIADDFREIAPHIDNSQEYYGEILLYGENFHFQD
jgi:hypothetical protein